MKLGGMNLGALVRLTAAGVVIFSIWGVVVVLVMSWAERTWPSDERRRVAEAELRPARANFRPIEGELPAAARGGSTYIPVYSTVYLGNREVQAGLAVTLSVRNTSADRELVVHRVDYHDTAGNVTMRLADSPHAVPAMATAEFFIDRRDPVGGPGANYVVEWSVPEGGTDPLIEAVMVGRFSNIGITFTSRGSLIRGGGPGGSAPPGG
jgi:Protein of unknown function (DUF3124)